MKENSLSKMYLSERNSFLFAKKQLRAGKGNFPLLA